MHRYEFEGKFPDVDPGAWVAPTATLIGDVTVEAGASVWFGVVIRADDAPIVIGAESNVQDNSVLHPRQGTPLTVGPRVTIGHGCIVHCDSIGEGSVVGNGAILLTQVVIGAGSVIAAGSLVTPGTNIPDGVMAVGSPARVKGPIQPGTSAARLMADNSRHYTDLMRRYPDLP